MHHAIIISHAGAESKEAMKEILDSIPELKGWTDYQDISSGLVNKIYKVKIKNKYKILRILNDNAFALGIDRNSEMYNFHLAKNTRVVPKLLEHGKNYMVTEYFPGKIIHNNDLKDKNKLLDIIESMELLHMGNKFVNEFDPFRMITFYQSWLRNNGYSFKKHNIKMWLIKKYLKRDPSKFVPCHNDIRAFGNIIETKDGIKFVDLEFTGNNDPCYEIGFLWSESKLSISDLYLMIDYYFEDNIIENAAKAQLYAIVADYMWYLQGVIGSKLGDNEDIWYMYSKITYHNFKDKTKVTNLIRLLNLLF